ncbi:head maturation protease, ClpP-related [uncultured Rikenella sp.]|uniref:head maturation protease, ClpP-related n=1 Tax=uncultured Rikenella sp. TaxID=368003 RepID=UPI002729600C|nr:head maturation protease, ClpP-related [uncultured Rikenella sp.]
MPRSYIDIIDREKQEATIRLYGTIGEKIDGDLFAQELASLDHQCELIHLRINSPGGEVMQGLSIVGAMLEMTTPIHVHVDGVAASMAAVIAVCGDRLYMYDFARLMIHDPYFAGADELTPKQKKQLARTRESLIRILSRRGKDEAEVDRLMSEETWFSAKEAKAAGLCDVIVASRQKALMALAPDELRARIDERNQSKNDTEMGRITEKAAGMLGIKAEAPEVEISAAIEALHNAKAEAEKAKIEAEEARAAAEKELNDYKAAIRAEKKAAFVAQLEAGVKSGKIDAKGIDTFSAMYDTNPENAVAAFEAIPEREPIHSQLKNKTEKDKALLEASWDELDKSGRLGELKAKYPDEYKTKFDARFHPNED